MQLVYDLGLVCVASFLNWLFTQLDKLQLVKGKCLAVLQPLGVVLTTRDHGRSIGRNAAQSLFAKADSRLNS